MGKTRVLIADDSVIYRSQIKAALAGISNIEVAGVASNGRIACDLLQQSKVDLLILDMEMPEMDGLSTLAEMKKRGHTGTKVLLFSSTTKRGSEVTLEALRAGADDFITKPGPSESSGGQPHDRIREILEPKIRALFPEGQESHPVPLAPQVSSPAAAGAVSKFDWASFRPGLVVIGSSTGGPTVLENIFTKLRGPLACPIMIAQHMPPLFTATFAERLSRLSGLKVTEAKSGELLLSDRVYIAPGDYHMTISGRRPQPIVSLNQEPQEHFVRPAVDPLFRSAASVYRHDTLAIILTGMGADGRIGCEHVRAAGGPVVIQSKETCAVFGMPGAVFAANAYDAIKSPDEIISLLNEKAVVGGQALKGAS